MRPRSTSCRSTIASSTSSCSSSPRDETTTSRPSRPEHAARLAERRVGVADEVQHPTREHGAEHAVGDGEPARRRCGRPWPEPRPRVLEHLPREVGAEHRRPSRSRSGLAIAPVPTPISSTGPGSAVRLDRRREPDAPFQSTTRGVVDRRHLVERDRLPDGHACHHGPVPVHRVADSGFDREAVTYERARPSYPPDCVAWFAEHLGIGPGRRVLDLAAGTGKFTRLLEPLGADLVAAEPVVGMQAILHTTQPGVPVLACTAEQLPFAARSPRRDHRRAGIPLVRRADRARGGGARPAPPRSARARVERARPQPSARRRACGRSWTASRRRRRGARTRSGARRRSPRPPTSGRCTRRRSTTSRS